MGDFLGSLVSGAASIYGADQMHSAIEDQISAQKEQNQKNIDMQREFAQSGIQWRVADAAKAGLSPLAAIGAAEPGFSPTSAVFPVDNPKGDIANAAGRMGQNLIRAATSGMSKNDRALEEVNLRKQRADADFAETQAKMSHLRLRQMASPPNPAIPDNPNRPIPNWQAYKDQFGNVTIMPSEDYSRASHATLGGPSRFWLNQNIIGPAGEIIDNIGLDDPSSSHVYVRPDRLEP